MQPTLLHLLQTDKAGGGIGINAKDIKNGKPLSSYGEWNAAVKGCMQHKPMSYAEDDSNRSALVKDVLNFIKMQ